MPPKKNNNKKGDDKKKDKTTASPIATSVGSPNKNKKNPADTTKDSTEDQPELKLDGTTSSTAVTKATTGPQSVGSGPVKKPSEPTVDKDTEMVDADEHDKPPKLPSQASNPHDTPLPKSSPPTSTPPTDISHPTDKSEHNKRAAELRAKEKAEKAKNENKSDQEAKKKKEAEAKAKEEARKKELAAKLPPHQTLLKALNDSIIQLQRGVQQHDQRLLNRVVRLITSIRKQMDLEGLQLLIKLYSPEAEQYLKGVQVKAKPKPVEDVKMTDVNETKDKDNKEKEKDKDTPVIQADEYYLKPTTEEIVPEVHVYVLLLVTLFALDQQANQQAATAATALFTQLQSYNRRTLDLLSSKIYYYYAYIYELIGQGATIRNNLLTAHRTACLQHNEPGQASLTTAILRNYLQSNLYSQADTFRLKSTFPENRSTHHHARYLYYLGKINIVQLHYSEAFINLSQALRKAPQKTAVGFRQHATKLLVCVQLLMGEIPERSLFAQPDLKRALKPYLQLTQAVRVGDLTAFSRVMTEQKAIFEKDKVYSLIVRLRHNVIKTGLRAINIAYSRISLHDICQKLKLESEEDVEYIVAKAIHDGVIDAVIDRQQKYLFSKENVDVYSTHEPETAFHKRITFCMQIHNDAVKALRFPPNAHKSQAELLEEEDEDDEGNPRATKKKEEEKKDEKKDDKEKDTKEEKKK